jgi:hypothetical protein
MRPESLTFLSEPSCLSRFNGDGFALVQRVLNPAQCEAAAANATLASAGSAGTRNLLSQPWCKLIAKQVREHPVLSSIVPPTFAATQCTYFEKSRSRNWLVSTHQDLSIPVAERVDHASLSGWSEKEGCLYVQAPVSLLQQLIAVRIHLDACGVHDGPLRVVPASHLAGKVESETAAAMRQAATEFVCAAAQGSALAMRPLVLHSSSKAEGGSRRRVLHFLFGPRVLPLGLRWQHAV